MPALAPPPAILQIATPQPAESIGVATMSDDGTIVMDVRTSGPTVGEAHLVYRRDNPLYQGVVRHLGGIRPGETRLVAPFPDKP